MDLGLGTGGGLDFDTGPFLHQTAKPPSSLGRGKKKAERVFCSRKLGRVRAEVRGAASLPDLHVVWDGFALAAQLDVEHSRVGGAERLQPHVHPLLAGHPSTWGGKQRAAGAGPSSGPCCPPSEHLRGSGNSGMRL